MSFYVFEDAFWDSLATPAPLYVENVPQVTR